MWWTVNNIGGPRRVNHAAVAIGDKIYSFGGYCTGENYKDEKPIDVFILNTNTYRWSALPKPKPRDSTYSDWPVQRYGHSISARGDNIYLYGGRNAKKIWSALYIFNVQSLTWSKPKVSGEIPMARDGHTSTIIGDFLYICGGFENNDFSHFISKLNLSTMTWSTAWADGKAPQYRDFHSATKIGDNKILIFGGRSEINFHESYPTDVHYLDTDTMTWHSPRVSGLVPPDGRRSHSAVNVNDDLLIFGGYNSELDVHYNDVWVLNTRTWVWKEVTPHGSCVPIPRRRHAMCQIDGGSRLFIFGGTSHYDGPPLYFTQEQLSYFLAIDDDYSADNMLIDLNDTYVLDLNPSLKTLCLSKVIESDLPTENLPLNIKQELKWMTEPNNISTPLRTLPLG
ncbi:Kelch domain-containing protein 3 [Lepeophtheirus salmonis]|uniref:Kelch domain-containing protein 3 n=2 Tax=Lepeophtheirus salmonis TaxID=72036 RepID=A0A7R8CPH8_LEPSM|nr:Kelch domain-containing protein 3 [Lepeophtheirus salmonis]CAF2886641.1 Kelch domain-containing protein 3 [Lepeophtheirus salmonis]